jgi:hypothetical protein
MAWELMIRGKGITKRMLPKALDLSGLSSQRSVITASPSECSGARGALPAKVAADKTTTKRRGIV